MRSSSRQNEYHFKRKHSGVCFHPQTCYSVHCGMEPNVLSSQNPSSFLSDKQEMQAITQVHQDGLAMATLWVTVSSTQFTSFGTTPTESAQSNVRCSIQSDFQIHHRLWKNLTATLLADHLLRGAPHSNGPPREHHGHCYQDVLSTYIWPEVTVPIIV